MADAADPLRRLTAARADFLDSGDHELRGVPDHVAASWRRSASSGVHPHEVASEYHTELDFGSRLVRCAQPVLEQLSEEIADIPMCVALTDNQARILSRRDSNSWIGRILDRVYFAQGFGYAEGAVGTNGVGTVLEFGESVHIVGAEHFVDTLQSFACAGAPIRDPFTGRIEGVLDISCLSQHSTPIMHSLVRSAARRIEHNLLLDRNQLQQALFDAYSRVDARSRQAVLAVGQRVVMANPPMQALLEPGDQEALQDHVRFLMLRHATVDEPVELPSGNLVRLRGSAVRLGTETAGMIGVVSLLTGSTVLPRRPHRPGRPPPRASRAAAASNRVLASRSPAWCAAVGSVRAALPAGEPILVLGEPGTGRFTLLAELHRLRHGADRAVAVPAGGDRGGAGGDRGPAAAPGRRADAARPARRRPADPGRRAGRWPRSWPAPRTGRRASRPRPRNRARTPTCCGVPGARRRSRRCATAGPTSPRWRPGCWPTWPRTATSGCPPTRSGCSGATAGRATSGSCGRPWPPR